MITGSDLIAWGFNPGKWFPGAIAEASRMRAEGADDEAVFRRLQDLMPVETLTRTNGLPYAMLLDAGTGAERANAKAVARHIDALMRVPTIVAGAMRRCPAGSQEGRRSGRLPGRDPSRIPLVRHLLLGRDDPPRRILVAVQEVTHFGPGGRAKEVGEKSPTPRLRPSLLGRLDPATRADPLGQHCSSSRFARTRGPRQYLAGDGKLTCRGHHRKAIRGTANLPVSTLRPFGTCWSIPLAA